MSVGSGRSVRSAAAVIIICAVACAIQARADASLESGIAVPPALSDLRGFRGRIEYVAHRDGLPADQRASGTLIVDDRRWSLTERTARYELRAGPQTASMLSSVGCVEIFRNA